MNEREEKKRHPLVERIMTFFYEGPDNSVMLDDYAVEQIEDLLKEYYGTPGLIDAILDLLHLSTILNNQGHISASMQILKATVSAQKAVEELNKKSGFFKLS